MTPRRWSTALFTGMAFGGLCWQGVAGWFEVTRFAVAIAGIMWLANAADACSKENT